MGGGKEEEKKRREKSTCQVLVEFDDLDANANAPGIHIQMIAPGQKTHRSCRSNLSR